MAWLLLAGFGCFAAGVLTRRWLVAAGLGLAVAVYGLIVWLLRKDYDVQENWSTAIALGVMFVGAPCAFLAAGAGVAIGQSSKRRRTR